MTATKYFFMMMSLLITSAVYSKDIRDDDNCVDCSGPKLKIVEGQPDKQPIKELVAVTAKPIDIAKNMKTDLVIAKTGGRGPASVTGSSKESYQGAVCDKFEMAQDKFDVKVIIKEIEASAYPEHMKEFWTNPVCRAPNKNDIKVPALYNTASDVFRSEKFPSVVYDYFVNKKNDRETWLKAINTKTSDGMTFLDFLQYNIDQKNYGTPELMEPALRIVSYLCKNGGVYSKYAATSKCQQ